MSILPGTLEKAGVNFVGRLVTTVCISCITATTLRDDEMMEAQSDEPSSKGTTLEEQELLKGSATASSFETLSNVDVTSSHGYTKLPKQSGRYLNAFFCITGTIAVVLGAIVLIVYLPRSLFFAELSVHFLVVGDWGRNGNLNQTAVASAMAEKASVFKPEFVISTGDNFYESGLTSVDDEQFDSSFTKVYHHDSLQIPWYTILGNHDYGEWWSDTKALKTCPANSTNCFFSPLHQLSNELTKRDWRWFCERWYEKRILNGQAEIFFIDTNPFILDYHYQEWSNNTGGILQQSWQSQILELEARLAASEAKWKLVIGHHPVRNQHMPENTPELMQHLEPVLQAQGVQAYFSGHEHNLQWIKGEDSPHYIVSGGGSLTDYAADYWDNGGGRFQHQGSGFVSCALSAKMLKCSFHGLAGDVLLDIEIEPKL